MSLIISDYIYLTYLNHSLILISSFFSILPLNNNVVTALVSSNLYLSDRHGSPRELAQTLPSILRKQTPRQVASSSRYHYGFMSLPGWAPVAKPHLANPLDDGTVPLF